MEPEMRVHVVRSEVKTSLMMSGDAPELFAVTS